MSFEKQQMKLVGVGLPPARTSTRRGPRVRAQKKKGAANYGKPVRLSSAHRKMLSSLAPTSSLAGDKGEQKIDARSNQMSREFARSAIRSSYGTRPVDCHFMITQAITSTAGGVINTVLANTSLASANDWTSLAAVFDEFELLGVSIAVEPYNKYSKTTTLSAPIIMVREDNDVTALAAYANNDVWIATSNTDDMYSESGGSGKGRAPVTWMLPADPLVDNRWQATGDVAAIRGSIKWYANTLSASTAYGLAFVTYLVRVRLQSV